MSAAHQDESECLRVPAPTLLRAGDGPALMRHALPPSRFRFKRPGVYVFTLLSALGCAATAAEQTNPSFPITREEAAAMLRAEAKTKPVPLDRPLVICGGIIDPGFGPAFYANEVSNYVGGKPIVRVAFADCVSFPSCRRRLVNAIDQQLGKGTDPDATIEVDVIGQSMGGLVARYSAVDDPSLGRRVKIRRLFTISSPLNGAIRAGMMPLNLMDIVRDMRPGSAFYADLAKHPADYEVVSYSRLRDPIVGERYAALPGHTPYWLDGPWWDPPHNGAFRDDRILLDIVRRLRGESPVTKGDPAPLPTKSSAKSATTRPAS